MATIELTKSLLTSDIREARGFLDPRFYSSSVVPVDRETRLAAQLTVATLGDITVSEVTFGVDLFVGFPELDSYHVNVPLTGRLHTRLQDRRTHVGLPGTAEIYEPYAGEVKDRWSADCRVLGLKIKPSMLHRQLQEVLGVAVNNGPVRFSQGSGAPSKPMASWCRLLRWFYADAVGTHSFASHPLVTDRLQDMVVRGLLAAADHQYRERMDLVATRPVAPRTVRRVIEAVQAHPETPYTVAALSSIAGVSARALQQGFRRHLGTTPMGFVRDVRLARAHDTLRRGEPPYVTVAAVAHRWGFLHLGRFSQLYRVRYGIPPSQTLRR